MKILQYNTVTLFRRGIAVLFCWLLAFAFAGCSEKTAPPVPREQADLLMEIYNDLELKRYEEALPKLRRYREINSTNVQIERMISQTITNIYMTQLRDLLDQGKFAEAEALMKDMLDKHDALEDRIQMRDFAARLNEVDKLIAALAPVQSSAEMRRNAAALQDRAKNLPNGQFVMRYARRKLRESTALQKIEQDRKIAWIYLDAVDAAAGDDPARAEMYTVFLAAQLQNGFVDPMVRELATEKKK